MKKKRVIEINIWDDITMEYISSIRPGEEELGLIIKGHLLIENILNQIIEIKFKNSKLLFDDNRTNSFLVKLNILYSLGFIPKYIFQNITNINKIRNQYAHNLKVDSSKLTFIYYREDKKINNKGYFKKKRNPVKEYIKLLCFGTLSELRNLFIKEFGKKP